MINLFFKIAMVIITINAFMFFVLGDQFKSSLSGEWSWMPAGLTTATSVTSHSQVTPNDAFKQIDNNVSISSGNASDPKSIPNLFTFVDSLSFIYNMGYYLLFGYFTWAQVIFGAGMLPLIIAFGVPIMIIQIIGLFYLLQIFLSSIGLALGFLK